MKKIIYRISLDMFEVVTQTTIKAKKGDTACSIYITLTENGKVYHISEGCYAVFSGKKPDGNYLFNSETCRIEDNTIIYDFTDQTTSCEGLVECEVILYKDKDRLTSARFNLMVDATLYNGEEIMSSPEADAFNKLYNDVENALKNGDLKGDKGDKGEQGIQGEKGDRGEKGADGKDADYSLVANALKGSKKGNPLILDDISPLEHEIKVTAQGDIVDEEAVVDLNERSVGSEFMPEESQTLVVSEKEVDADGFATFYFGDGYYCSFGSYDREEEINFVENTEVDDIVYFLLDIKKDTKKIYRVLSNGSPIQISVKEGDKEAVTFTADENGNVNGIFGKGETMTFSAEVGVDISVEYNRDINKSNGMGGSGADGEDGATFIPSVSEDGIISWTNNKGLDNPPSVNIKGAKGDKGDKGDTGATGANGLTPYINANGNWQIGDQDTGIKAAGVNGTNGDSAYDIAKKNGFDGTEAEWLASLKGEQGQQGIQGATGATGDKGDKGDKGEDGATAVPFISADGELSWDCTNGRIPLPSPVRIVGEDGYTPQKYIDYFTDSDISQIVDAVYARAANGNEVSY